VGNSLPETSLALGFYLAHPPAVAAGYVITSRILAYAFFKLGAVGLLLMSFGIRFQSSITRTEKKFFLISSLLVFGLMLSGSAVIHVAVSNFELFQTKWLGSDHSRFS
jgi:Ca2+/Na+ antiporter